MQTSFVQSTIRTQGASMAGKTLSYSSSRVAARVAVKTTALFAKAKPAPATKVRVLLTWTSKPLSCTTEYAF